MRSRITWVTLLVLLLALQSVSAAATETLADPVYETNAECLACHGTAGEGAALTTVDFSDSIDYESCGGCHWVNPDSPYGFGHSKVLYLPDCTSCHLYMPTARPWAGTTATPYGYFATPESLSRSAADIHAAHIGGSWPANGSAVDCDAYCASCHAATSCSTCHTASVLPGRHGSHVADAAAEGVAEYAAATYLTAGGAAPSPEVVSTVNVSASSLSCAAQACHPRETLLAGVRTTCVSCHETKVQSHGYEIIDHVAADALVGGVPCSGCHVLDLATAHGDPQATGASCTLCHPAPRDTVGVWDQSCATGDCHTSSSAVPMHAGADVSHALPEVATACMGCHEGVDLAALHVAAAQDGTGAISCLVCHTGVSGAPATNDCTVCHFTFDAHYPAQAHSAVPAASGCRNCHSMDLKTEHDKYAVTCLDCHNGYVDAFTVPWDKTCDACHTTRHSDRSKR